MRHQMAGKKLGRSTKQRKTLRRTLIQQLFHYEKIKTTEAKAKAIKGQAEKIITLARNRGDANEAGEPRQRGADRDDAARTDSTRRRHVLSRGVERGRVELGGIELGRVELRVVHAV